MSDMIRIRVNFGAYSNINYIPSRVFEYDRDEWMEADEATRNRWVDEDARDWLLNDVDWDWREA